MKTNEKYSAYAQRLSAGESLTLAPLAIKARKKLTFTCTPDALGEGRILVGHGKEITAGSWLEITASTVSAFSYYSYMQPSLVPLFSAPIEHGLSMKKSLLVEVELDVAKEMYSLVIEDENGRFSHSVKGWDGCNGEIFAAAEGVCLSDCTLTFDSESLGDDIFVLGDSFVSVGSEKRWPYYLFRDGYTRLLLSAYPGMGSPPAAEQFHRIAKMGRPRYAVWALGMNNGDTDGVINADYLRATEDFLAVCKAYGITPVLATIPNTPVVNNRFKNAWVRLGKHRYIDFAAAVGSDENEGWHEGMLFSDGVHPDTRGAEALYQQILKDFSEIKECIGE